MMPTREQRGHLLLGHQPARRHVQPSQPGADPDPRRLAPFGVVVGQPAPLHVLGVLGGGLHGQVAVTVAGADLLQSHHDRRSPLSVADPFHPDGIDVGERGTPPAWSRHRTQRTLTSTTCDSRVPEPTPLRTARQVQSTTMHARGPELRHTFRHPASLTATGCCVFLRLPASPRVTPCHPFGRVSSWVRLSNDGAANPTVSMPMHRLPTDR